MNKFNVFKDIITAIHQYLALFSLLLLLNFKIVTQDISSKCKSIPFEMVLTNY